MITTPLLPSQQPLLAMIALLLLQPMAIDCPVLTIEPTLEPQAATPVIAWEQAAPGVLQEAA